MKQLYLLKQYINFGKRTILILFLNFVLVYSLIPLTLALHDIWQRFMEYHQFHSEGTALISWSEHSWYQDSIYGEKNWKEKSKYLEQFFSVGKIRNIMYVNGDAEDPSFAGFVYSYDSEIYERMKWDLAEGSTNFVTCSINECISVIVGSAFAQQYQLGDIFSITLYCEKPDELVQIEVLCQISGFLKETGVTFLPNGAGNALDLNSIYNENDTLSDAIFCGEILDGNGNYLPCTEMHPFILELGNYSEQEARNIAAEVGDFISSTELEKNTVNDLIALWGKDIFFASYLVLISVVCIVGFQFLHYLNMQERLKLYRRYGMCLNQVIWMVIIYTIIIVLIPAAIGIGLRWHFYDWMQYYSYECTKQHGLIGIIFTSNIMIFLAVLSILFSVLFIRKNLKSDLKLRGDDLE